MPRRRQKIQTELYRDKGSHYAFIYFPGSKQHVVVMANGLTLWELKNLFYTAAKVSLSLLDLKGKIVTVNGHVFNVSAGPYTPLEGECHPEECPHFYAHFYDYRYGKEAEVWVYFQRRETSTKAIAIALSQALRMSSNSNTYKEKHSKR